MKNSSAIPFGFVLLIYGLLASIAMLWDFLSRGSPLFAWTHSELPSGLALFMAAVVVAGYVLISQVTVHLTQWGRQLEALLKQLLTPMSYLNIAILALVSGFLEEWFFRGILYSHFGIVLSSLFFGLCHLVLVGKLWIWSLTSFFMGVLFCLIVRETNSLILCALMHSGINAILLVRLNRSALERPDLYEIEL